MKVRSGHIEPSLPFDAEKSKTRRFAACDAGRCSVEWVVVALHPAS